jgi:hypothetical protein
MAAPASAFDYASDRDAALELLTHGASPSPLCVCLPRGCRGKRDLLTEYVRQLRLPDYFGWNWDALEECLRDLSWLEPGQAVLIWHAGLPLRGQSRRVYLELLDEAARHWRESSERQFRVAFSRSLETRIERLLGTS